MATTSDLKQLSLARLKSVEILITGKDWDMAGYLMGYVLECALKAATCLTLRQEHYPGDTIKDDKVRNFFQTHNIDRLLLVSGLSDVFNQSINQEVWQNWSNFTFIYSHDWPEMRYNFSWDESKVKKCYTNLTEEIHGILAQFDKHKRW